MSELLTLCGLAWLLVVYGDKSVSKYNKDINKIESSFSFGINKISVLDSYIMHHFTN